VKNPSGKKLEKLVFGMFDQMVEGADKYVTEQGSTWLIFAKEKKWVVEFTKDKTLWFNYNLFKSELELIGKDCVEEKDLIKNWFESRFLNTNKVNRTSEFWRLQELNVEDTIQNGVRHTCSSPVQHFESVEDTIQNGVRHTDYFEYTNNTLVEDTIQNGVKETTPSGYLGSIEMKGKIVHQIESPKQNNEVEDTIQNGVKDTHFNFQSGLIQVEDVIQNGVRHTEEGIFAMQSKIEDTIQNGVRHTNLSVKVKANQVEDTIQNGVRHISKRLQKPFRSIKDAIQNGVKETRFQKSSNLYRIEDTRTLWGKSGDEGVVEYIIQEGVKDIIEDSYPHKHRVEGVIRNTNKYGI